MSDQTPAAPPPQIQRGDTAAGPGDPTPLPYGEAAQTNDALAAGPEPPQPADQGQTLELTPEIEQTLAQSAAEQEQQPQEAQTYTPGETGLNPEDEKWLMSPTEHPDEAPTTLRMSNPVDGTGWLPQLAQEAQRPDASPQIKAIFKSFVLGPEA